MEESIPEKVKEIMGLGYGVEVKDPYRITLTRGSAIIDLCVHPTESPSSTVKGL